MFTLKKNTEGSQEISIFKIMGKVTAICTSEKRGMPKILRNYGLFVANFGLEGDAHAGEWHRQISFLEQEKIDEFNAKGAKVEPGAFGENVIVSGIEINALPVGTWLQCNDVIFEITQIGKECHDHCQIYYRMGECIMPRLGTFAKVLKGGDINVGDEIRVVERDYPLPYQAAVITLSDKGFKGEREDLSGPLLKKKLKEAKYEVVETILLPDEPKLLVRELKRLCDQRRLDLILTTGGTGFSPRDMTPEATKEIMDRDVPGISEAIRMESMKYTKKAMLSRGASVIRGKTLIINLPGSPKACEESINVFLDVIGHGIELLRNNVSDCARKD